MESDFFHSLNHLADFYHFQPLNPAWAAYPYNLYLSFEQAEKDLAAINKSLKLKVMQRDGRTAIAAEKEFDTCELYYIPVKPLHLLLQDKRQKKTARLLLSLFSVLYRKGVSYHSDCSFLGCQYEMIYEWVYANESDWEPDEHRKMVSDCNVQMWYSNELYKQIRHPYHAAQFVDYLRLYRPQSEQEQEIHTICMQFQNLFSQYPDDTFFRQITPVPESDYDNEYVYPENYLSFFWTDDDGMYESLIENVNTSLQECTRSLDPASLQFFDTAQERETHDFYFEWRFLLLIDHLCYLLYKTK